MMSLWHGDLHPLRPTMRSITADVAKRHGLTVEDLRGPERRQAAVRARHEAMAIIRAQGRFSLPQIGKFFNRDHTTVIHALRRVEERMRG